VLLAVAALAGPPSSRAESASTLELLGMTFVSSRAGHTEMVDEAARALLDPAANLADLEDVRVRLAERDGGVRLEMECDQGQFDLENHDFLAQGNVRGRTGDGRRFSAPWIRYDDAKGLAVTDAPVKIVEDVTTLRGSGFRYHVREGRFQLLQATLVQTP
jgi:LPS export ABC transporter protein LptC